MSPSTRRVKPSLNVIAVPVTVSGICLFFCSYARALEADSSPDSHLRDLAHRSLRLVDLALQEYALGVADGKILKPAEYEEALVFLRQAQSLSASLSLGPEVDSSFKTGLSAMEALKPPDVVAEALSPVREAIVLRFGVPSVEVPYGVSAEVGALLFRGNCGHCHQLGGRKIGDRFAPDLRDPEFLKDLTPLQMTTVISEGIPDSPMVGWAGRLTPYQIWSIVYGLMAEAFGPIPAQKDLRGLPVADPQKSYRDWLKEASSSGLSDSEAAEFARKALLQPLATGEDFTRRLALIASLLNDLSQDDGALRNPEVLHTRLTSLYAEFEEMEGPLLAKSISRGTLLETRFQSLLRRSHMLSPEALRSELSSLASLLRQVGESPLPSPRSAFAQSFLILIREGAEVLLLIGALLAVLRRLGASRKQGAVWLGAAAAVLASILLFFVLRWVITVSGFQIAAEGVILIVGSIVLIYMVLWLSRNVHLARLKEGFSRTVLGSSSVLPISVASFAVVFREGLETALFYQALIIYTGNTWIPVLAGGGAALAVLVLMGYLILVLSVRLPIKWFFGISGALLFVLAFSFLGKGIFALQTAGLLPMTVLPAGFTIDWLGVYPIAQTLIAQALLALFAASFTVLPLFRRRSAWPYQSPPP